MNRTLLALSLCKGRHYNSAVNRGQKICGISNRGRRCLAERFGGWHKDSLEVITKLGRQVSRQTGKEEDEIVRQLRQRVAILLVRDNVSHLSINTL